MQTVIVLRLGDGTTAWNDLPYFLDAREEEVGDHAEFLEGLTGDP